MAGLPQDYSPPGGLGMKPPRNSQSGGGCCHFKVGQRGVPRELRHWLEGSKERVPAEQVSVNSLVREEGSHRGSR